MGGYEDMYQNVVLPQPHKPLPWLLHESSSKLDDPEIEKGPFEV